MWSSFIALSVPPYLSFLLSFFPPPPLDCHYMFYTSGSQRLVPQHKASGNLIEMQIIWSPSSRPSESETLQVGLSDQCFKKPFRWFLCMLKFLNNCLMLILLSVLCVPPNTTFSVPGEISQVFAPPLLPPHLIPNYFNVLLTHLSTSVLLPCNQPSTL